MKIVFIGCVEFSFHALSCLLDNKNLPGQVVGVVCRQKSSFNSDFKDLTSLTKNYEIPTFLADQETPEALIRWLKELAPDVIYCFGWSYLLKSEILTLPRWGCVGFHPAALPRNRGRHPLIWAVALGLSKTASSFFWMEEGADTGDLLNQKEILIDELDDARTLYAKMTQTALVQIQEFTEQLAMGKITRTPQDHSQANSWRKRGVLDGQIDWRMSRNGIYNLVRALTRPYVGAHCLVQGHPVKIWRTEKGRNGFENLEPGKVIAVDGTDFTVKCGDGLIQILDHEFKILPQRGEYL